MNRMSSLLKACCFSVLTCLSPVLNAADGIEDAEASFNYISSTLQTFRGSGRLVNNPGIDGSDLEYFIALLDGARLSFSGAFNSESAMCRFYRDPENGRMTIEERAELSFSFLRDLADRITLYISANAEFKQSVEDQFGRIVLDDINEIKLESVSNQRLPASAFDEAATINFLDSMCT
ncbi:MAG: hypothetical protein COB20_13980 [SAR86 cluster bacterium]|uniref:Uncharacterized protein n=1 Tax=SAR86 cluster bacterium TaxID=2030880 RepID=A0A2A4WXC7_9GAMM|nr:MAG: hypothetical protein COB20_13980 [SAR86 cluster bacterium]